MPQPPENILGVIQRRGYDLKKFGIKPIGWEEPEKDAQVKLLQEQLAAMKEQISALEAKKK